jgi:hypothetical protein
LSPSDIVVQGDVIQSGITPTVEGVPPPTQTPKIAGDIRANFEPVNSPNSTPPKVIKRNSWGLIEGVDYVFAENGSIDWRKMIPNEYLYINPQIFSDPKRCERFEKKYQKKAEEIPIEDVGDNELVILLAGIKYLADLRGYLDVSYRPVASSPDYCSIVCRIEWRPNYETEGATISFESTAGASLSNTDSFGKKYIMEIAENRAFNRAVRNFLKINIVSQQEITKESPKGGEDSDDDSGAISPFSTLRKAMEEKGVSFDRIKSKLIEEKVDGAEKFESVNDIPKVKIMSLISRIKNIKKSTSS